MKLLTGTRLPVQERTYVPSAHGTPEYQERQELVSSVRLREVGPDAHLTVRTRGSVTPLGVLIVLAQDADELLERLFRDTPPMDRNAFQVLMDEFEEALLSQNVVARTLTRRRLLAALDTMAADLEMFVRTRPSTEPGRADA